MYSINRMIVDGQKLVVALDWTYSNADGSLSNVHQLQKPYGKTPLAQVTEAMAIEWLVTQLQNTSEEFDAAIAARKAEAEYVETFVPYVPDERGRFAAVPEPVEEPVVLPAD